MRTTICDQCEAEVGARGIAVNIALAEDGPTVRGYSDEPDEHSLDFCSYGCLSEWATEHSRKRGELRPADAP
jgi:hypothetical protein